MANSSDVRIFFPIFTNFSWTSAYLRGPHWEARAIKTVFLEEYYKLIYWYKLQSRCLLLPPHIEPQAGAVFLTSPGELPVEIALSRIALLKIPVGSLHLLPPPNRMS
jgi:hypothetical protein